MSRRLPADFNDDLPARNGMKRRLEYLGTENAEIVNIYYDCGDCSGCERCAETVIVIEVGICSDCEGCDRCMHVISTRPDITDLVIEEEGSRRDYPDRV